MNKEYKIIYKQKPKKSNLIPLGIFCFLLAWFLLESWKYFWIVIEGDNILPVQGWGFIGYIISIFFLLYCLLEFFSLFNKWDKYKHKNEEPIKELFFTGELKEIQKRNIPKPQKDLSPKFKTIFEGKNG